MRQIFVTPTDCSFHYDECPCCWWRKINKVQKPGEAFPSIFRVIDSQMKLSITPEILQSFGIPCRETVAIERVRSATVMYPDLQIELVIGGNLDRLARLDDDTYAVIDFKSGAPSPKSFQRYWRQLHAYEHCLRTGTISCEVSLLGLLWFTPSSFKVKDKTGCLLQI